jgi:hypothetical protein
VRLAYQALTDYGSRLSYNIEHGLPDPPKHGKRSEPSSLFETMSGLVPGNWYIWAFVFVFLVAKLAYAFNSGLWTWEHVRSILP